MSTAKSGIDFFVAYAEAEGALAEAVPEGALLVLPEELRGALNLPEEVRLTADPETAREDGFLLVTAGHPLLLAGARTVLARGDVGCATLPRQVGLPPTPGMLEDKARQQVSVDHGRIEVRLPPVADDLLVLRVGALVTYSISIDEQVQELDEVWVEASSGREVPAELSERLRRTALEAGATPGTVVPTGPGVTGAHQVLCAHAAQRVAELARQTSTRLRAQLGIVDDYYERVLAGIEERSNRAGIDRAAMLAEQAEATRREWARRRSEVADDLTPSFEVQPFRLHLVAVPAYVVPGEVRRGARPYPLPLTYLPVVSSYLPPRCPSCGAQEHLVAGKDRLGCRSCMAPGPSGTIPPDRRTSGRAPVEAAVEAAVEGAVGGAVGGAPPPLSSGGRPRAGRQAAPPAGRRPDAPSDRAPGARSVPTRASTASGKRSTGRTTPKGSVATPSTPRSGMRVATAFWSSVRSGELRARDAVAGSPMGALLRLYGALGPAFVVGLEDPRRIAAVTASPVMVGEDGSSWVVGELEAPGDAANPFGLTWRTGSRASYLEVEGFPLEELGPLLVRGDEYGRRFRHRYRSLLGAPPDPIVALGPTASLLLDRATRFAGLGYAVRCLAVWWLMAEGQGAAGEGGADDSGPAAAAAVESLVAKRLRMRVTVPALAERYGCPVEDVRRYGRLLLPLSRRGRELGW